MLRSFGIWHTKCFPKETPPTQDELEDLCKKLGFSNTSKAIGRVTSLKGFSNETAINEPGVVSVTFNSQNATKVVPFSKFSAVKLNDGFTVHLRPSKPLAKLESWDDGDHEKCHRMDLKCLDE